MNEVLHSSLYSRQPTFSLMSCIPSAVSPVTRMFCFIFIYIMICYILLSSSFSPWKLIAGFAAIRLPLSFNHFPQTSLWPPAPSCPGVAISWLEWEGFFLCTHPSVMMGYCHGSIQGIQLQLCLAWSPTKVTSTWDNIYTTISCLAALL